MRGLAAGVEQTSLFTGLQTPVAQTSAGRQLDVAHRIADIDAPFLARDLEDVAEQDQVPLDGRRGDLAQALVAPAGDVDTADAGDKPAGEGMAHYQAQAVGLGLGALLQRGDLFQVAFEQLFERGRLGLGTGLEGLGLQRAGERPESKSECREAQGWARVAFFRSPVGGGSLSSAVVVGAAFLAETGLSVGPLEPTDWLIDQSLVIQLCLS